MRSKISIIFFLLLFIINSCTNESDLNAFSIGGNFITSQSSVVMLDTFTVNMSTVIFDSIVTSSPENLLAGKYQDEFLGSTGATSYFQLDLPSSQSVDKLTVFDSLNLVLNLAGISYGDTLKPMTLSVHRLTEDITLVDDYYMYNTSTVKYEETPLGSITFLPRPSKDTITIRLDNSLGREIFLMMKNSSDEVSSLEKFQDFLKGLALVSDSKNDCVLAFTASDSLVNMVISAHKVLQEKVELLYKFPFSSSGISFNHTYFDRTGTPIENLKTQKEEIISVDSDNKSYIQGGAGIVTRLDFPGLGKIMEISRKHYFYKAELIFKPFPLSNSQIPFPTVLNFYSCDKSNRLVSQLVNSSSEALVADYSFDEFYNENNYYSIDITSYVRDELGDSYFNYENGLIINFPSNTATGTFDRLVLDARNVEIYKPKLKIYFLFYE